MIVLSRQWLLATRRLLPLLDQEALFTRRWQVLSRSPTRAERAKAERMLKLQWYTTRGLWEPQTVADVFPARLTEGGLSILATGQREVLSVSTSFRQRLSRRYGVQEFKVGVQVVTVGKTVVEYCGQLARLGMVLNQFLVHGLAAELTEALAVYSQQRVEKLAGWKNSRRYSPGYPVLPELADQKAIFRLLNPKRIGVRLTRSYQMVPEYSTSAILIESKGRKVERSKSHSTFRLSDF
jgi:cobalamin-dependent methionine synthase I